MSKTREPTYLEVMEIMTKNQMGAAEKLLDKAVDEYLVARNAAAEAKTVLAKVPITDDGLSPEHRAVRRGELMMDNARHSLWDASIAYHEAASAAMDRIWDAERAVKPLDQETMERKERRAYKQAVSALKKEN
ncbi:MAG: hypothetical protein LAO04_16760 [Acidobacteriia bacterium]|nr:hypothetical protein [Terriglobia bacterium]